MDIKIRQSLELTIHYKGESHGIGYLSEGGKYSSIQLQDKIISIISSFKDIDDGGVFFESLQDKTKKRLFKIYRLFDSDSYRPIRRRNIYDAGLKVKIDILARPLMQVGNSLFEMPNYICEENGTGSFNNERIEIYG